MEWFSRNDLKIISIDMNSIKTFISFFYFVLKLFSLLYNTCLFTACEKKKHEIKNNSFFYLLFCYICLIIAKK